MAGGPEEGRIGGSEGAVGVCVVVGWGSGEETAANEEGEETAANEEEEEAAEAEGALEAAAATATATNGLRASRAGSRVEFR